MKRLIILATLLLTVQLHAQFNTFIEFAVDPKMALEGPHEGKPQDTNGGTFNFEIRAGFDFENQRFGATYESHHAINYDKIAVFYDHKFNDKIGFINARNFTMHLGVELGMVKRTWPDAHYSKPDNYREVTHTWPLYGFNLGLYYNIKLNRRDTGLYVGANWNMFRGETEYKRWKKTYLDEFRNDFMISIVKKFNF